MRVNRLKLESMELSIGKKGRLYKILYGNGVGNGTALILPIDQGLEHGPRDFFANEASIDPEYQLKICVDGGYSGIVFQIGLAEKYMSKYAGKIPLILKINGKTSIPSEEMPISPLTSTVEDAVRLGADAVGYTMYVGSKSQTDDMIQFNMVRKDAERLGMPVIMWSYPRGEDIESKGGRNSIYAVDYAARVACELGADAVKLNMPEYSPEKASLMPSPYNKLDWTSEEMLRKIVRSAGRTLVFLSGGEKVSDEVLLQRVKDAMEAGVTGFLFGRNIWQRRYEDAIKITQQIKRIMSEY